jgi:hypothetical protein
MKSLKASLIHVALLCLLVSVLPVSGLSAHAAGTRIELGDCRLAAIFLVMTDAEAMQDYLPSGYTLQLNPDRSANANIYVFSCSNSFISSSPETNRPKDVIISFVGIQIVDRVPENFTPGTHWDQYLVWLHTNDSTFWNLFRKAGFPAYYVPGMSFDWRNPLNGGATEARVPWKESPFDVTLRAVPNSNVPHLHENTYQHGPYDNRSLLRLSIEFPVEDWLCAYAASSDCAEISTAEETAIGKFLSSMDPAQTIAVDHQPITQATLTF